MASTGGSVGYTHTETFPGGIVRERHREFAVAYRKRTSEWQSSWGPIVG